MPFDHSGYIQAVLAAVEAVVIRRRNLKILFDPVNGSAIETGGKIFSQLGKLVIINDRLGQRPPRPSEPRQKTLTQTAKAVVKNRCDLGIALDMDADRVVFIDEAGVCLSEDLSAVILAEGKTVVTPINSSGLFKKEMKKIGVRVIESGVGPPEIIAAIKKHRADFAYEESGKYFFCRHWPWADGLLAGAKMLAVLAKSRKKLSQIRKSYPEYFQVKLAINCPWEKMPKKYIGAGLKKEFKDSWLFIRSSGTEPLIRVFSDSPNRLTAEQLVEKGRAMRRIGGHLSTAGGLDKAVERAVALGANCLQIFSCSPRMWLSQLPDQQVIDRFNNLKKRNDINPVFIHAKYLINLASDKTELLNKSIASLKYDLQVAELIKARGVIVHLGSHQGRGFDAVKQQLIESINSILQDNRGNRELIIENSAGQKGKLCSQLSEIKFILGSVNNPRLTWCLDTCHAYAAGYSIGKVSENTLIQNDIVTQAQKLRILDKLICLHVNDSRDDFGSGRDRHANLGEGKMGLKILGQYVNHPKLKHLPLIIETPGFNKLGPDKKNLEILKKLCA